MNFKLAIIAISTSAHWKSAITSFESGSTSPVAAQTAFFVAQRADLVWSAEIIATVIASDSGCGGPSAVFAVDYAHLGRWSQFFCYLNKLWSESIIRIFDLPNFEKSYAVRLIIGLF